ncbi:MAG TPA: ferritin-like domain-containing protein [Solirubrobacteraceae bacterium]|nr:ferritin-like domain-containing protein [Solirubrobacteraceae bacterium]
MSGRQGTVRSRRELVADVLGALTPARERRELRSLLDIELLAGQVYALAGGARSLSPAAQDLVRRLGAQEYAHVAALARLAGLPAGAPPSAAAAERTLAGHGITVAFASLRTEREWFTLLEELERLLEGVYFHALGHLTNPAHALLLARIMASEAQHSTLLFSFRNPRDITLDVAEGQIKGRVR